MKKKKIFFLVSNMSNIGGVQRVTQVLANCFVNSGFYDVGIINVGAKNGKEKFLLDRKIKNYYCRAKNRENSILNLIEMYKKVSVRLKDIELEDSKVIAMGIGISYLLPFLIKDKSVFLIGMQHSIFRDNIILNKVRSKILNKLNLFITINKSMYIDTKQKLKLENIKCIENPMSFTTNLKSSLNNNRVIAVGRLSNEKGFDMLIDIWNLVNKKLPGYKLDIIGEGKEFDNLKNKIKLLKLENSIQLKGKSLNIEEEYIYSDLCLSTSRYEGFGLTLIEAQSCGVPVIAFNCSSCIEEIIKNDVNGIVVESFNLNEYAEKLIDVLKDKRKLSRMSSNGIQSVKSYSIIKINKKWAEIL